MFTHPSTVLNELLTVDIVQSGYSDIVPLGLDEPASQLLIFATHGLQHHLCRRLDGVQGYRMYSGFDGRERTAAITSNIAVAVDGLLLREPEGRDLPRQPIHVRFGLCLQGIFQLDLLLS